MVYVGEGVVRWTKGLSEGGEECVVCGAENELEW